MRWVPELVLILSKGNAGVCLRLSPGVFYTRNKAAAVDTQNISEYLAMHHSIRRGGFCSSSLNGVLSSFRPARDTRPGSCVLYESLPSTDGKPIVSSASQLLGGESSMHQYLVDTEYATSTLVTVIYQENQKLDRLRKQAEEQARSVRDADNHAYVLYHSCRYPWRVLEADALTKRLRAEHETMIIELSSLEAEVEYKAASLSALAAALLQIAKQGLSLVYGEKKSDCPDGRTIGTQNLKEVIWEGRNQAAHYDSGRYKPPVKNCFARLASDFGSDFDLAANGRRCLAKEVIGLLGWQDYATYRMDMEGLLCPQLWSPRLHAV